MWGAEPVDHTIAGADPTDHAMGGAEPVDHTIGGAEPTDHTMGGAHVFQIQRFGRATGGAPGDFHWDGPMQHSKLGGGGGSAGGP